ncbi:hypothetical protein ACET3X_001853 [Alternaria dauci]|uniref:FAD-binding PCMH-type domain-containing protein n=1 Tax=Alternaria dauci TaxID=48095 RepID=A0ABR3UYH7_9PLEO
MALSWLSYMCIAVLLATVYIRQRLRVRSSQLERDAEDEKPGRLRLEDGLTASGRQLNAKLVAAIPHIVITSEKAREFRSLINVYWDQKACEVSPACFVRPRNVWELAQAVKILKREFHLRNDRAKETKEEVALLSLFNQVTPAEDGQSVVIGAGCKWIDVYSALEKEGLAVAGGRNSAVGVSGLTLGGGLSFFSPEYGFVCNNVLTIEVVLADGSIVNASEKDNPTLWRALKGGGNNFGIVTGFTVRSFAATNIWSGFIYLLPYKAPDILSAFHSFVARTLASELQHRFDPHAAGPLTCFTYLQSLGVQAIAVNLVHTAPDSKLKGWPESWRSSGFNKLWRLRSTCKTKSLASATDEMSVLNPPGRRQEFATTTIKNDRETLEATHKAYRDAIPKIRKHAIKGMSWTLVLQSCLPSWARKGDANPLGLDEGSDESLVNVQFTVNWALEEHDEVVRSITREAIEQIDAFALEHGTGHRYRYLNYCAAWQKHFEGYGEEDLKFLQGVSKEVDPEGLFQRGCGGGFKLGL